MKLLDEDYEVTDGVKTLRKNAFDRARESWTDWQPRLSELLKFAADNDQNIDDMKRINLGLNQNEKPSRNRR